MSHRREGRDSNGNLEKGRPAARTVQSARISDRCGCDPGVRSLAEFAWPRSASAQSLGDDPFTLGVASAIPPPMASCCGRGWRRSRSKGTAACRTARWSCSGESPPTSTCGRVVDRGSVWALPALGHSVHVEVAGIEAWPLVLVSVQGRQRVQPDRSHAYRARAQCRRRPELRLRLVSALRERPLPRAPASGAGESRLRGASGRLHLRGPATSPVNRPHLPDHEITSIEDYRIRYGLYKSDPDLQAVHAAFPVDRHLGRSRDGKRLRRVHSGERRRSGRQPAGLRVAPRPRLSGLLRAHAAARRRSCRSDRICSCIAACGSAICCRSTCWIRGSIARIARRPPVPPRSESAAIARARSIRRGRSRARRSSNG